MSPAGYSQTPLVRKLGIRAGDRVATLGAPPHLAELLGELPPGATVEPDPPRPRRLDEPGGRGHPVVLAFFPEASALKDRFDHARRLLAWHGGLWACWPKLSSPLARDLREADVRALGLSTGLVDNKVCAVDHDWSGLRFVYRLEDRP